jgi:hypothetical protein
MQRVRLERKADLRLAVAMMARLAAMWPVLLDPQLAMVA